MPGPEMELDPPPPPQRNNQRVQVGELPGTKSLAGSQGFGQRGKPIHGEYKRVDQTFFVKGKVFKVHWFEPSVANPRRHSQGSNLTRSSYENEHIYDEFRRFVVILPKCGEQHGHSICVPIHTYGTRGTAKPGITIEDHAVIYTGNNQPDLLPREDPAKLTKSPIRVIPQGHDLHAASRVNFGKIYTVEHNLKVLLIGQVAKEHLRLLDAYYTDCTSVHPLPSPLPAFTPAFPALPISSDVVVQGGNQQT